MTSSDLQPVARAVLRRAQQHGYVVPRDIRHELKEAELAESRWKEVVELLRESLNYRQGRYYLLSPSSSRLQQHKNEQQTIRDTLAELLQRHALHASPHDRRQEERTMFIHPLKVCMEDGQEFRVLCRDLSLSGVRFISHRSLLGRKISLYLPQPEGVELVGFVARVLWTTTVADGLFENGGTFLEVLPANGNSS